MTDLLAAFKNESLFTKKALGQHFLTNKNIIDQIASAAEAAPGKNIIEIGPGCGVLTQVLAESGAEVKGIELDGELADFLQKYLFYYKNLEIIRGNALDMDFASLFPGKPVTFAGNLPYNQSVKIFERAALSNADTSLMVFMFQKEVADRIAAGPGSKIYSSLSVFSSYLFDVIKVRDIGGGNFKPNAGVTSTVLKFVPKKTRPLEKELESGFFSLLRRAFSQKRKTLKNNLRDKNDIDNILSSAGLTSNVRAEELSTEDFLRLYGILNVQ